MSEPSRVPLKKRLTWHLWVLCGFAVVAVCLYLRYSFWLTVWALRAHGAEVGFPDIPPYPRTAWNRCVNLWKTVEAVPTRLVIVPSMSPATITATLKKATQLRKISRLVCRSSKISDDDLKYLAAWPYLGLLELNQTNISNTGLVHVNKCSNLVILNLSDTRVGDAGLKLLSPLVRMRHLDLSGTGVTDAGLLNLTRMTHLTALEVARTQVTSQGLQTLEARVPGLNWGPSF